LDARLKPLENIFDLKNAFGLGPTHIIREILRRFSLLPPNDASREDSSYRCLTIDPAWKSGQLDVIFQELE